MSAYTPVPVGNLRALVASLVGQVCWSATCGGAAGSNLMLDPGRDVPRKRPQEQLEAESTGAN